MGSRTMALSLLTRFGEGEVRPIVDIDMTLNEPSIGLKYHD